MGLFDKIIKGVVTEIIKENTDKKSSNISQRDAVKENIISNDRQEFNSANEELHDKNYFRKILNSEFSRYEIRENISVSEIGGEGRNLEFGLYETNSLKAVVVLVEHNRDNNRGYNGAKAACKNAKIPFINFYLHMPNKREFVIYRINNLLTK